MAYKDRTKSNVQYGVQDERQKSRNGQAKLVEICTKEENEGEQKRLNFKKLKHTHTRKEKETYPLFLCVPHKKLHEHARVHRGRYE